MNLFKNMIRVYAVRAVMGVKRKRVLPEAIKTISGVMYARRGNQNHRVCKCMVFHMNCIKCNDLLARRKSDYVSLMVKHAREASAGRQVKRPEEDHRFDPLEYHRIILDRISSSNMLCECLLCESRGERQRLSVRGPNKMSMDRTFDSLGYTHEDQILKLVSKSHHSFQRRDGIPTEITSRKRNWLVSVVSGICKRSRIRYSRTSREIDTMKSAQMNVEKMREYLKTHLVDRESCREMISRKRKDTPDCSKCGVVLDYGDTEGFISTKNNPRQASPDRINDRLGYTPDNVNMVCCACQTMGAPDDVHDVFLCETQFEDLQRYLESKIGSLL